MSNLKLVRDLKSIFFNDKTLYEYSGKMSLNRFGMPPNKGKRWQTPAEIARQMLSELGYATPYDVPEFKQTKDNPKTWILKPL